LESQSFLKFLLLLIIFVGLPGSGKTTIGRQMGRRLGLPFLDSDSVIEQRLGCSIREFLTVKVKSVFRDIEQNVLDDLSKYHHGVLSTGGGAVLRPLNRQNLHTRGKVVYLRSTPEEVFRRLKHDMQRPLLQVDDPQEKLRALFNVRDPLYRETAHFIFETGRPSINRLLNTIIAELDLDGFDTHAANANPSRT
jgi:shikimate kinase